MASHLTIFEQAIRKGPATPPACTVPAETQPKTDLKRRPPVSRRVQKANIPFIRGPVPLHWLTTAAALSRSAARLSVALWYQLGLTGQHVDLVSPNEEPLVVRIDRKLCNDCELKRWHVGEGIRDLESAGLIKIIKAGRGRCPEVAVVVQRDAGPFPGTTEKTRVPVSRSPNTEAHGSPRRPPGRD